MRAQLIILICIGLASPNVQSKAKATLPPEDRDELASIAKRLEYRESVSALLNAEIAMSRGEPTIAIANLLKLARIQKSAEYAAIATERALEYRLLDAAKDAAKLWAQLAPNELQAQLIAMTLVINTEPSAASQYLKQGFATKPTEVGQHLLIIYPQLTEEGRSALYSMLTELSKSDASNSDILHATALLAIQNHDITLSESLVAAALKAKANNTQAIQTMAKIIKYKQNSDLPALKYLQEAVNKFSSDSELRLFYAQALLDAEKFDLAKEQLLTLQQKENFADIANIYLGNIALVQKQQQQATKHFLLVTANSKHILTAKYYLGQLAEDNNNITKAIEYYQSIDSGQFHIPAALKVAALLVEKKQFSHALNTLQEAKPTTLLEQKQILLTEVEVFLAKKDLAAAYSLLSQALTVLPHDIDILYARSLLASQLQDYTTSEQDLRTILKLEPNNAHVLNALGYTIAIQPNRTEEGINYLQQAMNLAPNNPAFMDSMAWALYKVGRLQDSVAIFKDAYNLSQDPNIAAHYGEVLWVNGDKATAKNIWQKALADFPEHEQLLKVMQKYQVKP